MTCRVEVLHIIAELFPNMTVLEFIDLINKKGTIKK